MPFVSRQPADPRPQVYILSDSVGETADAVAKAALTQFEPDSFRVARFPRISSTGQLEGVVRGARDVRCVILYTLATPALREEMAELTASMGVSAIDLLGTTVEALSQVSGLEPEWAAGLTRRTDRGYFERLEALDFAVKHDDGRAPEELDEAEIVLIGVSRSSKTPLAMYLAFKGYKVSNIPLVPQVPPPPLLFDVDPRRVYGLVTSSDVLVEVRKQRLPDLSPYAPSYFDRECIERELEDARALMRSIGCMTVSTETRAIEETAQEILRYYRNALGEQAAKAGQAPQHAAPGRTGQGARKGLYRFTRPGD